MRGGSQGGIACLAENTLTAFAEGKTDQRSHARIEAHLADCDDCRAVLTRAVGSWAHCTAPSARDDVAVQAGTRVGRYVVDRLVGRGSMGAVYAATDPDLDRRVAVKLLRADTWSDDARRLMRARLLREAQAMARLSHPEVITVYDVGTFGDQLFVAMEYIEGETLRRWRAAGHRTHAEILAVYERAGSGLAAAHEAGLVHRDFKPDNVLVGRDGRVRVTDFGLARMVHEADAPVPKSAEDEEGSSEEGLTITLTRTGTLLGTPAYMAPEQLRGGGADARSDVFSFCVALYEALYGERPFDGSTVLVLQAAIEAGAVRRAAITTRVPGWVRAILLRGLRAAPEERFSSMRKLLDALRTAHATWRRRNGLLGALLAGALGLTVLATGISHSTTRSVAGDPPVVAPQSAAIWTYPVPEFVPSAPAASVSVLAEPLPPIARPAPAIAERRAPTFLPQRKPPTTFKHETPAPAVGNNGALILE
jgi:predicted Ser/Thr protein kinase